MKKYILLLLLICLSFNLFSQFIRFNKTYDTGHYPLLRNILITNNGYIGLGGKENDYYKVSVFICGFDSLGNKI